MAQTFAHCEHRALSGKIVGIVGRFLDDANALEMLPQRMRGIGQPAVSESVGNQKVAEFVGDRGMRNGKQRKKRRAYGQSEHEHGRHHGLGALRQPHASAPDPFHRNRRALPPHRQHERGHHQRRFEQVQVEIQPVADAGQQVDEKLQHL